MHHQSSEQCRIFDGHFDDDMIAFDDATSAPIGLISASNYATKLLEKFSAMRNKPELCDFRIDVNNKQFRCHKFLLMATSDYFKTMFNGNMCESQSDHVELKDFERSSNGIEAMIDFCYSGSLLITFDNIDELLHAATHLQIFDAINLCCQFLIESCSIKNCIDIYKISDFYSLDNVLFVIKTFISRNFVLLMIQAPDQFEQLTYEQISDELSRDTLEMHNCNEHDLFVMTCAWIEANRAERDRYAADLFQLIRFMLMTPEQLCDSVRDHELIKCNEQSRILVQNALCYYALPNRQPLLNDKQCQIRNEPVLVAVGEVELFTLNTVAEKWETLCQAPLEENYPYPFSAITVNNYLYVLGTRRSSSEEYKSCYRFSARTCEWTKLQNLLHDRSRFAAAYVDSYIYIMGGFEGFKRTTRVYVNTIERYSIEDDQWESFSTDGPQLSSLAACAHGESIFLGGGKNGQWSKIADFYCFSIEKRQLEKRSPMLNARTTHAFHLFDGKILAIGGFDDDGNGMLSIESYDIHADQWTILTSIPGAVSKTWPQSLGTVGRYIYISVFHTSNSFIVMQEDNFILSYDVYSSFISVLEFCVFIEIILWIIIRLLSIIEDVSTSPPNTNGNLSPSSNTSLDVSANQISFPCCIFRCKPNSHPFQERCIPLHEQVKVGRAVARLKALPNNAIFDCKVLSRQHAKLWYENGKFLLQDTKSSNGTFVNNERLGKCNEESPPFEIFSDDIVQFGVDVTENNRKTTHNCIIMEVKLFHADGSEALPRSANGQSLAQIKELDINTQTLYQLAQYIQEAMNREQMLEQKLEFLQGVLRNAQQTSNDSWQAIINEDRLLARINSLEDQLRIYRTKHPNDESIKQELVRLTESHMKFEEESKMKLEKALLECADSNSRSKAFKCALQIAQDELKRFEQDNQQHKQDIQQLVQSVDEQRSMIADLETKLADSQTRCTEIENEKQRIQSDFDEYYQRTQHLEELQQKSLHHEINNHNQPDLQSSSISPLMEKNDSVEIPIMKENGEHEEIHRPTMIPSNQIESVVNHNHKDEQSNDLIEAQKQILLLREQLNEANEHLTSTEDSYRNEQEQHRTLQSEHDKTRDELVELKRRLNQEKNDNHELVQEQRTQLDQLSKSILSKQTEHDQLLRVYLCFFLFYYLFIFFLFFSLLS
ncbi:unnamed protein product [Adineta ricciae]|uniref:Uncharacterized protein n=1 Tax=Adineta ricciae TaxID=249248 RepID=A0A814A9A5_ADIRI|nr:unnamed protein product [Adineta ricciae]